MTKRLALLAVFLALPLFAADDTTAKLPVVPGDLFAKLALDERNIINVGRQMDQMTQKYQQLAQQDQASQKQLQEDVQAAYTAIGDPKKEKYDLDLDTLTFKEKPAPKPQSKK